MTAKLLIEGSIGCSYTAVTSQSSGIGAAASSRCVATKDRSPAEAVVCLQEASRITLGDEDLFLPPRLDARYPFSYGISPGGTATGEMRRFVNRHAKGTPDRRAKRTPPTAFG
jgi:hypothetical protein